MVLAKMEAPVTQPRHEHGVHNRRRATAEKLKEAREKALKEKSSIRPFRRKKEEQESKEVKHTDRLLREIGSTLQTLGEDKRSPVIEDGEKMTEHEIDEASKIFAQHWKLRNEMSEVAFSGLLLILEHCLSNELANHERFESFVDAVGYNTVFFWKKAVPLIYDSDMQYGTNYRDALLFSLALYDANLGRNRLRELFAAVPGLRDSLLGKHAKKFEEQFHHLIQRRNSFSSPNSCQVSEVDPNEKIDLDDDELGSDSGGGAAFSIGTAGSGDKTNGVHTDLKTLLEAVDENGIAEIPNGTTRRSEGSCTGSNSTDRDGTHPETIVSGGLATGHFQERVINVSNAPPVSLKKRNDSGQWELGQGSGGLVSCCDPVMNENKDNMWLACFGPGVKFGENRPGSPLQTPTNSLGLPILKKAPTEVFSRVLAVNDGVGDSIVNDQMSLIGILKEHNKDNYQLNPVSVREEDYNTYYGGISNGLLWPAFHNLGEYIVSDYDDPKVLKDHWHAYVRVNYQFAINAVRNSRPQDFIWVHDYHLLLSSMCIRSLDPNIEVGFFLHIPFQPPEDFFTKYPLVATAVLRGILRFTKVGFQTHKDRSTFLSLVSQHLSTSKIKHDQKMDTYTVTHDGWVSSHGVFPVSIKNEEFLDLVNDPKTQEEAANFRKSIKENCLEGGKIFFSVERFDYTKGIKEKLVAYERFLKNNPERWGKDVLVQVAVINRRGVETYRQYQDEVLASVEQINTTYVSKEAPNWKPIVFLTEGLPRPKLVSRYLGMDVGVVTPKKDGMNLVAKEMMICNPKATVILSSGAGTEQQLSAAGFYTETAKCYHRVVDVYDPDEYAAAFLSAANEDPADSEANSKRVRDFLMAHDIERWSQAFLDPSWTHEVIQVSEPTSLAEFYSLMFQTRNVRRQIVERVLKGIHIRNHFGVSLKNAQDSLKAAFKTENSTKIQLKATDDPDSKRTVTLDVADEYQELEKDLGFLEMIQSEDYDNVEQFLQHLEKYHPESPEAFHDEIEEVVTLISRGDYFHYFFTDRDGTLKSYSCSYPASIQPSYSGVIQATFAQRCTQIAAILTSAPLMNIGILDVQVMADSYYCYGASTGREWYVDASQKFKDNSIPDEDQQVLQEIGEKIQDLLEKKQYHHFAWIGSGLQKHYGHITIARQDPVGSVDEKKSLEWLDQIKKLVNEVDPKAEKFEIQDLETDIKIYVKQEEGIFNKGDGLRLFAKKMELDLNEGRILVCGDSESDLSMLEHCLQVNPKGTYTVWVTRNEELRQKVSKMCGDVDNANFAFVSCPEVILGAMGKATVREITIRPTEEGSVLSDEWN